MLLLSHVLAWKLAYNWEGLLHTQFSAVVYHDGSIFTKSISKFFSKKAKVSYCCCFDCSIYSKQSYFDWRCSKLQHSTVWWMKKFGFKIKVVIYRKIFDYIFKLVWRNSVSNYFKYSLFLHNLQRFWRFCENSKKITMKLPLISRKSLIQVKSIEFDPQKSHFFYPFSMFFS